MGPIGHGNDLTGSVRFPVYCTGVAGLLPSFGRVPALLPSAAEARPLTSQFAVPVLGRPGVSVPTGLADGLPMGVQLVGRRFREDTLLDARRSSKAGRGP